LIKAGRRVSRQITKTQQRLQKIKKAEEKALDHERSLAERGEIKSRRAEELARAQSLRDEDRQHCLLRLQTLEKNADTILRKGAEAENCIVREHLGLVREIALRLFKKNRFFLIEIEDLLSAGEEGLCSRCGRTEEPSEKNMTRKLHIDRDSQPMQLGR